MGYRWFGIARPGPAAYDPCTGLVHAGAPGWAATKRNSLDDATTTSNPVILPRELERSWPLSICWSPIVTCNLHCPHCLDDKTLIDSGPVERQRIAGLIGQSGVVGVDISGGEPLLIPELPQLVNQLRMADIVVSVTTNGWRLADRATQLVDVVDAVRVSFDGATADTHDRLRGHGSFARALEGLRSIVRLGIPAQVQTVAMRTNLRELQQLMDIAAAEGAYGLTILQMLPIGEGAALAGEEALSDDELCRLVDSLRMPPAFHVRVRQRSHATGFTVVRADGCVWRNESGATSIANRRPLVDPNDLLAGADQDGSA